MNLASLSLAQPPAADPGPGVHTSGRLDDAANAGTLRNPDGADRRQPGYPIAEPFHPGEILPAQLVPGYPTRGIMRPSSPTVTFHDPGPDLGGSSGIHGELAITVGVPTGKQTPFGVATAKSFRAPPQPYDANVYNGFVPDQPAGDQ